MPPPTEATLPVARTQAQTIADEARQRAWEDEHRAGFFEAAASSLLDTSPAVAVRWIMGQGYTPDPTWKLDQQKLDQLAEGLDPDLRTIFGGAVSEEHAIVLQERARQMQERRNILASRGWQGTALRLGSSVIDPGALAVGTLSGGASYAVLGARATRIGRMVQAGLVAGVPMAGLEAMRASEDPSVGPIDIVTSAAGGFGLGAGLEAANKASRAGRAAAGALGGAVPTVAIGALGGRDTDDVVFAGATQLLLGGLTGAIHPGRAFENILRDVQYRDVQGMPLTEKGKAYFKDQIDQAERVNAIQEPAAADLKESNDLLSASFRETSQPPSEHEPATLSEAVAAEAAKQPTAQGAGAAYANSPAFAKTPPRGPVQAGDLDLSNVNDSAQAYARGSFTMGDAVSRSKIESHRLTSNALSPDPLLKADGSPSVYTAPEWVQSTYDGHIAQVERFMDRAYGEYVKSRQGSSVDPMPYEDWRVEVTKAARRAQPNPDPTIEKAAKQLAAWSKELVELGQRHNVNGFDTIDPSEKYIPRVGVRTFIDAAVDRFGYDQVLQTVAESIAAGTPGLKPNIVAKLARVWVEVIGKVHDGSDIQRGRIFDIDQREALTAALNGQGLSPTEIDSVLFDISGKADPQADVIPRAQKRIGMDETFARDIFDAQGTKIGRLAIEDLLENDALVLQRQYARQVIGASAMAEVFRINSRDGQEPIQSMDGLMAKLEKDARDMGLTAPNGKLQPKVAADLEKIRTMGLKTLNIPERENTIAIQSARVIRSLNFTRLMANIGTGVQNAAEVIQTISEQGWRASLQAIPAAGDIIASMRSGAIPTELLRDIESLGIGVDRLVHRVRPRATADDGTLIGLSKAEELAARAARLASDVSLVGPGQELISKLTATAIMNKWAWQAKTGELPSAKRLASWGIPDEALARKVLDEINTYSVTEPGIVGPKMVRLNLDQWDPETASRFRVAVAKEANRIVLRNNPAAYAKWMTHPMGQVVSQLRTFAFGSWRNKLLFELQQRDRISLQNVVLGTVVGGLVYAARTYVESLAQADPQKYRDQRLSPGALAAAGFSRAAWSSMIPTAIDTVVSDIGQRPPLFSASRTTGLEGGAFFGNPTFDWANAALHSLGAVQAPFATDYDFSREDVRNLLKSTFIPNIAGLKSGIEYLTRRLPAKSLPRNQK